MYHQTLVIVAFLPAFFLGWKLPAIVGLLGCSMSEPLGSTKGRILLLIMLPWTFLVMIWAFAVGALTAYPGWTNMVPQGILYIMIALSICATGMLLRNNLSMILKALRRGLAWIDQF